MGDGTISMADGIGIKAVDSNELRRKIRGPPPTHQNLSNSKSILLDSTVVDVSATPLQIPPLNSDSNLNHSSEYPFILQTSEHSQSLQPHPIQSDLQALKLNIAGDLICKSTVRSPIHSASLVGFGEFSPNSAKKSSPSRRIQQVFEQALIREAEERAFQLQVDASQSECHHKQVPQKEGLRSDSEARMLEIMGHLEEELNISEDPFILDVVTAKLQSIQQSWRKAETQAPPSPSQFGGQQKQESRIST